MLSFANAMAEVTMMKDKSYGKTRFAFCVHSHQPAGNPYEVMEKVYRSSYEPFFSVMSRHGEISFNAHFSGYLLEWMRDEHPEFIQMVSGMVSSGQLEILGGGLYEPIIPSVPSVDAVGQIRGMNDLIRDTFGKTPRGMWLAERVWEPNIPEVIGKGGLEYTLLDDVGFINAGMPRDTLSGHYKTEYDGSEISIFPINREIRDAIPFQGHIRALNILQKASDRNGGRASVFGDDCEKFGSWPGTYEDVYEKGWLEKFLRGISRRNILPMKFSDILDSTEPTGVVYLPTCSYHEMMTWALNPGEQRRADRIFRQKGVGNSQLMLGAAWRNFLLKYSESMQMYWKIRFVSEQVSRTRGMSDAQKYLYMGEANDTLWHGVFGGIYLPVLRMEAYSNLIRAQILAEKENADSIYFRDFSDNLLGHNVFALSTNEIWASFRSDQGLEVMELDSKRDALNVMDTIMRREESYHSDLKSLLRKRARRGGNIGEGIFVKDLGDSPNLIYDQTPRRSFKDVLFSPDTDDMSLMSSSSCNFHDQGSTVKGRDGSFMYAQKEYRIIRGNYSVLVNKQMSTELMEPKLRVKYRFSEQSDRYAGMSLGCEINISAFARKAEEITVNGLQVSGNDSMSFTTDRLEIRYGGIPISLTVSMKGGERMIVYPVETLSNSEEGIESILQGICIIPCTTISDNRDFEVALRIEGTEGGS